MCWSRSDKKPVKVPHGCGRWALASPPDFVKVLDPAMSQTHLFWYWRSPQEVFLECLIKILWLGLSIIYECGSSVMEKYVTKLELT